MPSGSHGNFHGTRLQVGTCEYRRPAESYARPAMIGPDFWPIPVAGQYPQTQTPEQLDWPRLTVPGEAQASIWVIGWLLEPQTPAHPARTMISKTPASRLGPTKPGCQFISVLVASCRINIWVCNCISRHQLCLPKDSEQQIHPWTPSGGPLRISGQIEYGGLCLLKPVCKD